MTSAPAPDPRSRLEGPLRPATRGLARSGVTPSQLSALALLGSLAVGGVIAGSESPLALAALPAWLVARALLDALAGTMAREAGGATPVGAVMGELGGVLAELGLYLPFALRAPEAALPVLLFAAAAALSEFCGVLGQALGGRRRQDGPMGRGDRALVAGAFALVLALHPPAAGIAALLFDALAALALLTCWNRVTRTIEELGRIHGA